MTDQFERTVRIRDGKIPDSLLPDRTIYGTGSPLGVVTATPGTKYVDEAGTLGAWEWLKKTGTGNTGWEVTHGDTGWRNVDELLVNGWKATVPMQLRRVNELIYASGYPMFVTGETTDHLIFTLPPGFRPPATTTVAVAGSFTTPVDMYLVEVRSSGTFRMFQYDGPGRTFYVSLSWATPNPWPVTL